MPFFLPFSKMPRRIDWFYYMYGNPHRKQYSCNLCCRIISVLNFPLYMSEFIKKSGSAIFLEFWMDFVYLNSQNGYKCNAFAQDFWIFGQSNRRYTVWENAHIQPWMIINEIKRKIYRSEISSILLTNKRATHKPVQSILIYRMKSSNQSRTEVLSNVQFILWTDHVEA